MFQGVEGTRHGLLAGGTGGKRQARMPFLLPLTSLRGGRSLAKKGAELTIFIIAKSHRQFRMPYLSNYWYMSSEYNRAIISYRARGLRRPCVAFSSKSFLWPTYCGEFPEPSDALYITTLFTVAIVTCSLRRATRLQVSSMSTGL